MPLYPFACVTAALFHGFAATSSPPPHPDSSSSLLFFFMRLHIHTSSTSAFKRGQQPRGSRYRIKIRRASANRAGNLKRVERRRKSAPRKRCEASPVFRTLLYPALPLPLRCTKGYIYIYISRINSRGFFARVIEGPASGGMKNRENRNGNEKRGKRMRRRAVYKDHRGSV